MYVTTSATSTAFNNSAGVIYVTYTTRRPDPPPAGVRVPAPEPLPPGPLRWDAVRLDAPAELERA